MPKKEVVTVTTKGQITLPSEIREQLDIEKGSRMVVLIKGGWIFMRPVKRLSELRGILKEAGKKSEELVREIRQEWDEKLEELT
jgi:AbrB family looped-hinge helix DNA binding protein